MQVGLVFGPLLARIWVELAAKLEAKLDPSWYQNLKNEVPKTISKKSSKKEAGASSEGIPVDRLLAPKKSLRDL